MRETGEGPHTLRPSPVGGDAAVPIDSRRATQLPGSTTTSSRASPRKGGMGASSRSSRSAPEPATPRRSSPARGRARAARFRREAEAPRALRSTPRDRQSPFGRRRSGRGAVPHPRLVRARGSTIYLVALIPDPLALPRRGPRMLARAPRAHALLAHSRLQESRRARPRPRWGVAPRPAAPELVEPFARAWFRAAAWDKLTPTVLSNVLPSPRRSRPSAASSSSPAAPTSSRPRRDRAPLGHLRDERAWATTTRRRR